MKLQKMTGVSVLIIFFSTVSLFFGQSFAGPSHDKGVEYASQGKFKEAIEINPRYPLAYGNRGHTYDAKGNMKKACSDWKQACELGDCSYWGIVNKIRCLGK